MRSLLFAFAFLIVLPAWVYGLVSGTLILALPGLMIFWFCIYYALQKLKCPNFGKAMRTISVKLSNCPFCGAEYKKTTKSEQHDSTEPRSSVP